MTDSDKIRCDVCRTDVVPADAAVAGPRGKGHWECVDPASWYAPEGEKRATIQVRPGYSFDAPTFADSGVRVDAVVDRIAAGDDDASIRADWPELTADELAIAHALDEALFDDEAEDEDPELAAISRAVTIGATALLALFFGALALLGWRS